jgi:deazaflavin-dependent oxidoreductase (nitroreductase family)
MAAEARHGMGEPTGITRMLLKSFSRLHVALYRLSGGRLGGAIGGVPALLLGTVGRRSGEDHTTPLIYLRDGERFVVVGSAGGTARHPAWIHNLRHAAQATVTVGSRRFAATASEAQGEERTRLFADLVALFPRFGEYQRQTSRVLPVVVLTPVVGDGAAR